MAIYSRETVARAYARISAAVAAADRSSAPRVHIGRANTKTRAVNEGTASLVTCCARACATCGRECYACHHIDNVYATARTNHAENTIARRRDTVAYYREFFAAAVADGVPVVRINETGDFENFDQVRALYQVADENLDMTVIGYTRRSELIDAITQAPANVHLRYSLYRDGDTYGDIVRRVRVACVHDDITTCPSQLRADTNKRRRAAGLPELPAWSCADCAARRCGCCGPRPVVVFRAH